jgi:hypothetical protein
VPHSLALSSIAIVALAALDHSAAKPCDGLTPVPALEQMLPQARVALRIPGTEQVELDPATRCIGIQVRSEGTARLVQLLLRGVKVPESSVRLRVVEPAPAPGA